MQITSCPGERWQEKNYASERCMGTAQFPEVMQFAWCCFSGDIAHENMGFNELRSIHQTCTWGLLCGTADVAMSGC